MAVGFVVMLGAIDYYTGHEFSFAVFYLAPIMLATWYVNKRAGLAMAVVAVTVWTLIDLYTGETYVHPFAPYWNILMRFGFYTVALLLIAQLKEKYELAEHLALTDPLTNLANRRKFFVLAELVLERAKRNQAPTTVAYVDVDDFKGVNDQWGHDVGDKALQAIAQAMQANARHADVVARLGGDEFVLLLPETDLDHAYTIIERIQDALFTVVMEKGYPITFSIGVMTFIEAPDSVTSMLRAADKLMYTVKHSTKNKVVYEEVDAWSEAVSG